MVEVLVRGRQVTSPLHTRSAGYLVAVGGIAAVTAVLAPLAGQQINATTVALALLLVVLFVATGWGSRPAILASVLGMLCFNYFFLPPIGTFTIADPDNWIALGAFLITAMTAGQLSARAKRRAEEAEAGRREIERLYHELQAAFERASHAEALRQSERLKSALLDAVTHDLRTPLTSIKAAVTTLLGKVDDETPVVLDEDSQRELLEVIDEETDRLNRFVANLVELARLEAGAMPLQRHWRAVDEILMTALERAAALTSRHQIHIAIAEDCPAVRVDARALAEVLYTLIDNATKYAPPGTGIRVLAHRADDAHLLLAVEDEGRGIPAALRERVFEKFFRAVRDDAHSSTRPTGIGLGLAIARGIVEAHGGRIWIEDGPGGRGTRVALTIPIGDAEPAAAEPLAEPAAASAVNTVARAPHHSGVPQ
jgi:two-component system sensor histidine kinase KdpD